jgi:putative transposase
MKYKFVHTYRSRFRIQKMCQVLNISRSGYYKWIHREPSKRAIQEKHLLDNIKPIFEESRQTYGSPRVTDTLNKTGIKCSRSRVARIMRKYGIIAKTVRKFKVTTQSDHNYPISPNLLDGDFSVYYLNEVWVSDITYIRTKEGWLYLTIIMDLYSRKIIGWSMSHRLTAALTVIPALKMACRNSPPSEYTIFHSDRGIQYACQKFREALMNCGLKRQSMSGKGNCYDNAVAESFFHTLKTELVYHESYKTRIAARRSIFEYIEVFYNRVRKHSAIGYFSPEDFIKLIFKNKAV